MENVLSAGLEFVIGNPHLAGTAQNGIFYSAGRRFVYHAAAACLQRDVQRPPIKGRIIDQNSCAV
jgi:hypothetical protein